MNVKPVLNFLSKSFNFNLSFQSTINSELSELVPCGFSLEKFHCFYSARNLTILFISHTRDKAGVLNVPTHNEYFFGH